MLNQKLNEKKVFRDPVHGYLYVEYQVIWDLINSSEMQRLRRIHQLGGTLQVFPTAEHSRFTHSLGVYEVARKIVENVQDVQEVLSEEEKIIVLCAALLHDVGHGPFSHAFELIHPILHESYSIKIILESKELRSILDSYDLSLASQIVQVISKTHSNPILTQIVSSQIDADRIDYLLRDAYFCGTPYGFFDVERILRVMKVKNNRIVFKESGIPAIENYVMGRYHMYNQVYYHPTSLSYEMIVSKMILRLRDLIELKTTFLNDYRYLTPFFKDQMVNVKDYLNLDESVLFFYAKQMIEEKDFVLKDLAKRFLNRDLLKYVSSADQQQVEEIKNLMKEKSLPERYYFHVDRLTQVVYKKYGRNDTETINVLTSEGKVVPLEQVSDIVRVLSNQRTFNKTESIVFYPKEIYK